MTAPPGRLKAVRQIVRFDDAVAVVATTWGPRARLGSLVIRVDKRAPNAALTTQESGAELEEATLGAGAGRPKRR